MLIKRQHHCIYDNLEICKTTLLNLRERANHGLQAYTQSYCFYVTMYCVKCHNHVESNKIFLN